VTRILLLQGANLTYLGRREPAIYGSTTPAELDAILQRHAQDHGYRLEIFYTNVEGEAINRIYRAVDEGFDGLVMNPAGFTYAGFALKDCIKGPPCPMSRCTSATLPSAIFTASSRTPPRVSSPASGCTPTYSVSTRCSRFCGRGAGKCGREYALVVPMKVRRASLIVLVDPTSSLRGARRRSNPWPTQTAGLLRCARNDDVRSNLESSRSTRTQQNSRYAS